MTSFATRTSAIRSPSILGSLFTDFALLFLPGIATLALFWVLPPTLPSIVILSFVVLYLLDSGHGYVTAMRIYLRPRALRTHSVRLQRIYWLTPIVAFSTAALWVYTRLPGLWTALVCVTLYHHLRQLYGVVRWYQKLNARFDRWSPRFLYALTLLPIVYFLGRPDNPIVGVFASGDLITFDWPPALIAIGSTYALVALAWIAFEVATWRAGHREVNRIMAIGIPAAVSGVGMFFGTTAGQIVFPLLVLHAVAYFALVGVSLERTSESRKVSWRAATAVAFAMAAACGMLEWSFEHRYMLWDYPNALDPLWPALIIGAYVTVPLSHYILDAFIWRGDHPEAKKVFAAS